MSKPELTYDPFTIINDALSIAYEAEDKNIFSVNMGGYSGNIDLTNRHYYDSPKGTIIVAHEKDPHRGTSQTRITLINEAARSGSIVCLDSRKVIEQVSPAGVADELAMRAQRFRCMKNDQ